MTKQTDVPQTIQEMYTSGAHFAFSKARRHPTFKSFIFGAKNGTEILNLEKTDEFLKKAEEFFKSLPKEKRLVLFVSSKSEAKKIIKEAAQSLDLPFVAGRWIGGTLTNFSEVRKRVLRLEDLTSKKENKELTKYTKKERLLIDREIENLERYFGGLRVLTRQPDVLFVVDSKKESIAVTEARKMNIPIVSLSSSDCDLSKINFPIPANDASIASISYFVKRLSDSLR